MEIDPIFKGMTQRVPFLDMIKDLKSMPPEYFAKVKTKSLSLEDEFKGLLNLNFAYNH
jgi:hypothetical protein